MLPDDEVVRVHSADDILQRVGRGRPDLLLARWSFVAWLIGRLFARRNSTPETCVSHPARAPGRAAPRTVAPRETLQRLLPSAQGWRQRIRCSGNSRR